MLIKQLLLLSLLLQLLLLSLLLHLLLLYQTQVHYLLLVVDWQNIVSGIVVVVAVVVSGGGSGSKVRGSERFFDVRLHRVDSEGQC